MYIINTERTTADGNFKFFCGYKRIYDSENIKI